MAVVAEVRPRGPYSLALSARVAGDATRMFRDGVLTTTLPAGRGVAWQRPDGVVCLRATGEEAFEQLRFCLAIDDDHTPFVLRFQRDPLLGRTVRLLRGLRPLRTATVAHALLRALCGQLILASEARAMERRIVRAATAREHRHLHAPPTTDDLARFSPAELRRLGLHARRGATLARLCRSFDLEKLKELPTEAVAERLERERGLGPWSVGIVCLEGLGRFERGLEGDLGLIKLLSEIRGQSRRVEGWETTELLEPYGAWGGLASVYMLAGYAKGLVPVRAASAA
jgi:AraC family transcriptional regulator, regulatory protein of adaptative response / DNA-3-methyladenine glycosylase II